MIDTANTIAANGLIRTNKGDVYKKNARYLCDFIDYIAGTSNLRVLFMILSTDVSFMAAPNYTAAPDYAAAPDYTAAPDTQPRTFVVWFVSLKCSSVKGKRNLPPRPF